VADFLKIHRVLEVGGIALLVAVDRVKQRAVTLDAQIRNIELAADIAGAGALDLDGACAEVCQAHGGGGTGEELGKVEDD
jgi:hypothetical protein